MTTAMEQVKDVPIETELAKNVAYINELIGVEVSWDLVAKSFRFGNIEMMSYAANGFFLTMNMVLILENLEKSIEVFVQARVNQHFTLAELVEYLNTHVAFVQVQPVKTMYEAIRLILSGPLVTFIDGYDQAFLIDTRIYPMRGISEPEVERVVRGPRDGFTETMLMNTSLIRRRLRDPRLRVELMQVGDRSQTDVSLIYLQDVTNDEIVNDVRTKLKNISVDAVAMGEQAITELIGNVRWNPYSLVRYTERPDVAATALIEGQVLIVVDTTPEVIIAPTSFFQHLQHPQEYHSYPLVGTYMRWVILFAVFSSIFLSGVFLTMNAYPQWIPKTMKFFIAAKSDPLPLWVELLISEIALDILRLAVINTPIALASSVGIIAALLFGQYSVAIGLLQPEVLVYMGFVMVAELATSSYELGTANQMARLWIIVWSGLLRGPGFFIASTAWLILLLRTRSFGVPYLWPLIPFRWNNGMKQVLFRSPTANIVGRPSILTPKLRRRRG